MTAAKYIHLNTILKFIKEVEGVDFQVIDSEKYGIRGVTAFKAIIPKSFKVHKVILTEDFDGCALFTVSIIDDKGIDAMEGSNILSDDSIENGMLIFENFKHIPPFVDSFEIMKHA